MAEVACLTTHASIVKVEPVFLENATTFADSVTTGVCATHADPIINARLEAAGYTTSAFGYGVAAPEILQLIAALLTAANLLRGYSVKHTGANIERADAHEARAMALLEDAALGKYDIGETQDDSGSKILVSSTPETRHAQSIFVGVKSEIWANTDDERSD